jgi:Transglycosylase SLT domain
MSTARKKTVAYVSCGFLTLTAVVAGAAVALTRTSTPTPAAASSYTSNIEAVNPNGSAPIASPPPLASHQLQSASTSPAALKVPRLGKLAPPDVIVTLKHPASLKSVATLRKQAGVHRIAVADRGSVRLHGQKLRVLGLPLSARAFTPSLTGSSNRLWQSIARGELTVAYANGRRLRHHLGQTYVATGPHAKVASMRIGAFATIGLDGTQALLSHPAAASVGLAPRREILVAAPKISLDDLTADIRSAFGAKAHLDVTRAAPVDQSVASSYATTTIPATYLDLYRRAAVTCPGLPWTVLAGIGTVETGNGANVHRSTAGAMGPMQFIRSTWDMYGYDADGDGKADINSPTDSVFSAARYLCAAGAGRGGQSLDNAIFSYNHAWWYVREVITIANHYA